MVASGADSQKLAEASLVQLSSEGLHFCPVGSQHSQSLPSRNAFFKSSLASVNSPRIDLDCSSS